MASTARQETESIPYQTLIGEQFDEDILRVIEHLTFDYESTDEQLASRTGMTVNEVRKTLYKLYDSRVATYHTVRDLKTSYFTHFWKLLPMKSSILAYRRKALLTIDKLKQRLECERNVFFCCGTKECPELTFEEAADSKFKCPVCSNPYKQ